MTQVKQAGLVAQGMMQVTEFSFECMAEILPCAYTKSCPILISYQLPPGQSLSRDQGDSHLDNFHWLRYTRHLTRLLDVEHPICQLLGIPIILLQLFLFNIGAH